MPSLPKSGAQAPLGRARKPTGPHAPPGPREGAPPGGAPLCQPLSPKPCFSWFAVYLFKHLQLPGAEGLLEAGSRRGRGLYLLFASMSALTSHNTAPLFVPGRDRPALPPPAGRGRAQAVQFRKAPSGRCLCPPPLTPAGTVAPRLSFLCKPELIKLRQPRAFNP